MSRFKRPKPRVRLDVGGEMLVETQAESVGIRMKSSPGGDAARPVTVLLSPEVSLADAVSELRLLTEALE